MNPNSSILPFHEVEVVVGYHGNQLRWYDDLIGGMGLTNVRRPNPHVLNLVGMKYVLIPPDQAFPPDYFGSIPVRSMGTFGQNQVVENDNAFPRVYLVDSVKVYPQRDSVLYRDIASGVDNLRDVVYLEEAPTIALERNTVSTDSVWIKDYEPESVLIGVQASTNKMLVLTDNYYYAWSVTIDGQPAKIHRAYGAFRAVEIPAGAGEVHFTFESPRYATAKTITLLTSLYLLTIIGFYFVRTVRLRGREQSQ